MKQDSNVDGQFLLRSLFMGHFPAATIHKSLDGLSPEEKINKLVKRLVDSEASNEKLKTRASQVIFSFFWCKTLNVRVLRPTSHWIVVFSLFTSSVLGIASYNCFTYAKASIYLSQSAVLSFLSSLY